MTFRRLGRTAAVLMVATAGLATMASPASAAPTQHVTRWVNDIKMDVWIGGRHCSSPLYEPNIESVNRVGGWRGTPGPVFSCQITRGDDVDVSYDFETYLGSDLRSNAVHHFRVSRRLTGNCGEPFGGRSSLAGYVPDTFDQTSPSSWSRAATIYTCDDGHQIDGGRPVTVRVSLFESWAATA
jgi:hypothetical protein